MRVVFTVLASASAALVIFVSSSSAHGELGRRAADAKGRYVVDLAGESEGAVRKAAGAFARLGLDVAGVDYRQRRVELILTGGTARSLEAKYHIRPLSVEGIVSAVDPRYHTPEQVAAKLKELADRYPRFAKVHEIGRTTEGRPILALEIATPDPVLKPAVLFDGMHHAREIMTPEIVLDIGEQLLQNAKEGSRVRFGPAAADLLSRVRVWIVPQVNPDGNNIVWTSDIWWRKNAWRKKGKVTGVDLNRNYPFQWGKCKGSSGSPGQDAFRGPSAGSEPETEAVFRLADRIRPIGYLTYHSFGELVLAPYGCQGQFTSENELLTRIGKALAESLPTDDGRSHYTYGLSWEVLYQNDGTSADHIFAQFGAPSYALEVNTSFQPSYSLREPTLQKHRVGWALFIETLLKNMLTVRVKDESGRPVKALVEFSHIVHKAGERAFMTDETGVFFKVLAPGQTLLRVTGPEGRRHEVSVTMNEEPQVIEITL